MAPPILQLKQLQLGYPGRPLAGPLDLSLPRGATLGIFGVNGVGKSTLFQILLGLRAPLGGSYHWSCGPQRGYVPQASEIDELFPLTVENVLEMGTPWRWGRRFRLSPEQRETLEQLKLSELTQELFRDLSGGQKQRVLLARALMGSPEVLLLDEPFSSLDYTFRETLWQQLKIWQQERDLTLLIIEHDLNRILNEIDHILLLGPRRHLAGSAELLRSPETLMEILESPLHVHVEADRLQVHFL